jgi:hypothetical protein
VAIVSHALWRRAFYADQSLIGQTIHLNSSPYTLIGIAPPGFAGPRVGVATDVWVPTALQPEVDPPSAAVRRSRGHSRIFDLRRSRGLSLVGRLPGGATIDQVAARAEVVASRLRTRTRIRTLTGGSFSRRSARAEVSASRFANSRSSGSSPIRSTPPPWNARGRQPITCCWRRTTSRASRCTCAPPATRCRYTDASADGVNPGAPRSSLDWSMNAPTALHEGHKGHDAHKGKFRGHALWSWCASCSSCVQPWARSTATQVSSDELWA